MFQQAVNTDAELFIEAQLQITAAMYTMTKVTVQFDSQCGNISYFSTYHIIWRADPEGGSQKLVHTECTPIRFSSRFIFLHLVYGIALGICHSFWFMLFIC